MKAVLRRARPAAAETLIRVAGLELDPRGMSVTVAARPLELTLSEYRLLEHLARHPGRVFSRAELLASCLPDSDALERTVDAHLNSVRRKLAAAGVTDALVTVRGAGYRLADRPG